MLSQRHLRVDPEGPRRGRDVPEQPADPLEGLIAGREDRITDTTSIRERLGGGALAVKPAFSARRCTLAA